MSFKIKTEKFEGPIELLLNLIEKRKLHISEVSLAKVADDYVEHVRSMEEMPVAKTAQFVLVASTLLLIKSISLLPKLEITNEEKESIEDLERRLKIYKLMKKQASTIKDQMGANIIFSKEQKTDQPIVFSPSKDMGTNALALSIRTIINQLPIKEILPKVVVKKVLNLEEVISDLTKRVQKGLNMGFKEFSNFGKAEKINVVVSFLAMLELVKQEVIKVNQDSHFGDISMETKEYGTPQYN